MSIYADYQHFRDLFGVGEEGVDKDSDDDDESSNGAGGHDINTASAAAVAAAAGAGAGCVTNDAYSNVTSGSGVYSSEWVNHAIGQNILDPDAISPDKQTLWLSTLGAHTPLHYDTYGCNLVRQLKGKKRWRLWCPTPSLSTPDPVVSGGGSHGHWSTTSDGGGRQRERQCDTNDSGSSNSHRRRNTSNNSAGGISSCGGRGGGDGDCGSGSLLNDNDSHDDRESLRRLPLLRIPYEESSVYSTYDPLLAAGSGGSGGRQGRGGGQGCGGGDSGGVQAMTDSNNQHHHNDDRNDDDNHEFPPDYDFVLEEGEDRLPYYTSTTINNNVITIRTTLLRVS